VPELPEVETIRRQLAPRVVGRVVTGAWAFDSPKFADAPEAVAHAVGGMRRRGKYLLFDLLGPGPGERRELVVHLGMTGRLAVVSRPDVVASPHLRARWDLDDGTALAFHDARRFGRIAVVPAGDHRRLPTLHALGPEPFDPGFTATHLRDGLTGRRAVKTVLLSQRVVAGVGNIYADEALWAAGVSPRARRLGPTRAAELHDAIVTVLASAIGHGGTTLRDYRDADGGRGTHQQSLACYGRGGLPCVRCGTPLRHGTLDGRGTTWCPRCQR
jgi:formamidopyrimidine-DNA glycosylase